MTISHDRIRALPPGPFVFAGIGSISCSICAPQAMTAYDVEHFANDQQAPTIGSWMVIDKAVLGMGLPTPNACNQVANRQHWFLINKNVEQYAWKKKR